MTGYLLSGPNGTEWDVGVGMNRYLTERVLAPAIQRPWLLPCFFSPSWSLCFPSTFPSQSLFSSHPLLISSHPSRYDHFDDIIPFPSQSLSHLSPQSPSVYTRLITPSTLPCSLLISHTSSPTSSSPTFPNLTHALVDVLRIFSRIPPISHSLFCLIPNFPP